MNIDQLREVFKDIAKPIVFAGDSSAFDISSEEVEELLNKNFDSLKPEDFINGYFGLCSGCGEYFHKYLLPGILNLWQKELYVINSHYIDSCHEEFTRTKLFIEHLDQRHKQASYDFIENVFIERCKIEGIKPIQRSSTHSLYSHLASLGTFSELIPIIWPKLWSQNTIELFPFQLQYITLLLFDKKDNPIFKPWTTNEGGGPPTLLDYSSLGHDEKWLDCNIEYLSKNLNYNFIEEALNNIVESKEEDLSVFAKKLLQKLNIEKNKLDYRCSRIIEIYSTPGGGIPITSW
jgi:hypothetical protein